ncbi:MAG: cytidine deaminase [Candidatus Kapabacteria bacterium]|nr:cytidine deaminase [Ignavibacteriota bacterium]MCW5885831.1 cytidine deaminase [Candidatus Kapabacteria bacterium]
MQQIDLKKMNDEEKLLVDKAVEMIDYSYSPYSKYKVGAALMDSSGKIHSGCNIESVDFTLTSHAEMVAIDSMVKTGCIEVKSIAVAARGISNKPPTPCGLCRQKISEFNNDGSCKILLVNLDEKYRIKNIFRTTLDELLPYSFSSEFL